MVSVTWQRAKLSLYRQFWFENSEHTSLNECVPLFRHATQHQPGAPHAGTFWGPSDAMVEIDKVLLLYVGAVSSGLHGVFATL